jgi:DNA-directed RNA polymerase subunit M/transcription elongation factor TFIIS
MITRQLRLAEATVLTASLLLGAVGGSSMLSHRKGHDFDLVASAHPATRHTSDTDRTAMFERARGKRIQADAVANASATCDSCRGTATAVQVIYFGNTRKGTADNMATAFSSCRDCGATSVSLQVVVARPGTNLTTRNRALAVNTSCSSCSTAAVAVQLVVITKKHRAFSREGREQLQALASQLEAELRGAARSKVARTAQAAEQIGLPGIEALVKDKLEPTTVQRHFDVRTG